MGTGTYEFTKVAHRYHIISIISRVQRLVFDATVYSNGFEHLKIKFEVRLLPENKSQYTLHSYERGETSLQK